MTRTRLIVGLLIGTAAIMAVLFVPVVTVELDETAVPTAAQARLPESITIASSGVDCASGGCWLDLAVAPDGATALDELLAMDGRCEPVSVLDRRVVCADVDTNQDDVVIHVSFRRALGL
ncbi:hypothetical protein [Cellulosimicrobium cellulans]|uniref:hypothetical protein n=1 Tax=Cellulosimicrobium cellulans TaxID=1710 RepID=UPI0008484C9F|nr:hypothetical protein [Cellulosimicrobium cellulans]